MVAATTLGRFLNVVGKIGKPDPALVIVKIGGSAADHVVVPLDLLVSAHSGALQKLLLRHELIELVRAFKAQTIIDALLAAATAHDLQLAISRSGLHIIEHDGKAYKALVVGGKLHWLGDEPTDLRVVLIGPAANRIAPRGTLAEFKAQLAPIMRRNPRLLVVLWMAIAGYFARALGRDPMGIAIIGPTSSGKSLAQDLVSSLLGVPDPVLGLNGSSAGVEAYLRDRPDAPAFIEDAQGESQAGPILRAIMDAGNATMPLRGNSAGGLAHRAPVTSTLVLSAEVSLADTARAGRQAIHPGIFARVFEMHLGQHGIFDHLCGEPDGYALAQRVQALIEPLRGVVGHHVVAKLAHDWEALTRHQANLSRQMRDALIEDLEQPLTPLQGRIADGLVFAAFLGYRAHKDLPMGVSPMAVFKAFRTVFKEHVERARLIAPPDQRECVERVRQYLSTHGGRFPSRPKGSHRPPKDIDGFRMEIKGERLFLFQPERFRAAFQQFGADSVLRHLRAANYLACTQHRGLQLAVRTPWTGDDARTDFYAIREDILEF